MRIALVCPYDLGVPGGVQSHVWALAATLRAAGDEVVLLGPGDGRGPLGDFTAVARSVPVRFNGSVAPVALGPLAVRRTRRLLAEVAPELVHVHEPMVPAVGLAAVFGSRAKVVATFHAWSSRSRAYRLARPLGRRVLGRLDAAVAVSPAAATYHAGALGVDAGRFRVIPNGVDVARFADRAERAGFEDVGEEPDNGYTLLFVGRLEPRKGLATLIEAYGRLRRSGVQVRLLVVGDGPERARCEDLLPDAYRPGVRFLGRVSDEELVACHAAADVYVSPAIGGESFGIVLLEAMAAGTPVVASDIPGYRAVVGDRGGVLVPPGDPGALTDVLASLLRDPQRLAALAATGRETAAAHDWSVVARRLRELYLGALAGGS